MRNLLFILAIYVSLELDCCFGSELDPSNTKALIVGVLTWQDQSLTTYDPLRRQDLVLYKTLQEIGIPKDNIRLLIDRQAILSVIRSNLVDIAKSSNDKGTLIVYYCGHGLVENNIGVFANYDIYLNKVWQTGWNLKLLSKDITDNFKGSNVILLADCCYSGKLKSTVINLAEKGYNVASITSATAANESTGNWTYTHSLIEGLLAECVVDINSDGIIDIEELAKYTKSNLLTFEKQKSCYFQLGLGDDFVIRRRNTSDAEKWNKISISDFVNVNTRGSKKIARVIDKDYRTQKLLLRFQEYNTAPKAWINIKHVTITAF